jgi:amino acid transporter
MTVTALAARLRHSTLSQVESLGQSIANIAPTLTPALNMAVVAKLAGAGSWLSYLIATLGMMFVAANIGALARRHPQAGSYFIYIGRTFGPFAGAMSGWSMIAAYLFTAVAATVAFTIFLGAVLSSVGLAALAPPAWLLVALFTGVVWLAGYRDIKMSSRLALVLEGVSVGVIVVITAVVVARHGGVVDPAQLDIAKLPLGGVTSGLTFAVFSFVGFESAATLAKETRDPRVAVPRAIMISAAGAGLFFVAVTYFMVLGMNGDAAALGASGAPFADLTAKAGLGWVAGIVYASALISAFACALASVNAASRLLYSMGRYQIFHRSMGAVHDRHQTPHLAVTLCCGFTVLVSLAVLPIGALDAFGLTGTFATLGFLVVYLLVCVAAPIDLRRTGGLAPRQATIAVIGVLLVGFVMFGSLYPVPPHPYDLLIYLFGAYMAAGAVWFGYLRLRRPALLARIDHDLEM